MMSWIGSSYEAGGVLSGDQGYNEESVELRGEVDVDDVYEVGTSRRAKVSRQWRISSTRTWS